MKNSKKSKEIPADLLADFAKLSISESEAEGEEHKSTEEKSSAKLEGSLCFLGTGSMIPLPSRTVSAILI